jgi:hypothetical protein
MIEAEQLRGQQKSTAQTGFQPPTFAKNNKPPYSKKATVYVMSELDAITVGVTDIQNATDAPEF